MGGIIGLPPVPETPLALAGQAAEFVRRVKKIPHDIPDGVANDVASLVVNLRGAHNHAVKVLNRSLEKQIADKRALIEHLNTAVQRLTSKLEKFEVMVSLPGYESKPMAGPLKNIGACYKADIAEWEAALAEAQYDLGHLESFLKEIN